MKKFMFFSIIAIAFLLIMPKVCAADDYGTVTDITKSTGDSLTSGNGTIKTQGNTTTIKYSVATFKLLDEDPDAAGGARPGPAAWVGFEVSKPKNDTDSSYKVTTPDNKTTQLKTYPYKDYVGITPENLKNVLLKGKILTTSEKGNDTKWSPEIAKKALDELNPNTGDINLFLIIGLIIVGGLGLVYCFKKA